MTPAARFTRSGLQAAQRARARNLNCMQILGRKLKLISPPIVEYKMPFTIDADVHTKQKDGKSLSDRTKKDYTAVLNRLAKEGWTTRQELKKHSSDVIAHIKSEYPEDDERGRQKKRYMLYAIFWAMDEAYIKHTNPYHKYLQEIPPITDFKTGKKWKPLGQFRAESKT